MPAGGRLLPGTPSEHPVPSRSNADAKRYKAYVQAMHVWAAELGLGDREDAGARLEAYLFAQR